MNSEASQTGTQYGYRAEFLKADSTKWEEIPSHEAESGITETGEFPLLRPGRLHGYETAEALRWVFIAMVKGQRLEGWHKVKTRLVSYKMEYSWAIYRDEEMEAEQISVLNPPKKSSD